MKRAFILFLVLLLSSMSGFATAGIINQVILSSLTVNKSVIIKTGNVSIPSGKVAFGAASSVRSLSLNNNALTNVSTFGNTSSTITFGSVTAGTGTLRLPKVTSNPQTYAPLVYDKSGAAVATTIHGVYGTVVGNSSTVTVILTGAAIFASVKYIGWALDTTTGVNIPAITAVSGSSFGISTTSSTDTYAYYVEGV